jgi:transcriptional regulator with XRE-family HTH domain
MAQKGDRAKLEPVARQRYIETGNLSQVADELGVSRQTLSDWKSRTRRPGEELDEWDRAREQKRSNVERLRALFDRELTALEETRAGEMSAMSLDAITKLGTLVQRWEVAEKAPSYDRPRVFLENLQFIAGWLRDHDPEGLKVLAESFDALTLAFKEECLHGNA